MRFKQDQELIMFVVCIHGYRVESIGLQSNQMMMFRFEEPMISFVIQDGITYWTDVAISVPTDILLKEKHLTCHKKWFKTFIFLTIIS